MTAAPPGVDPPDARPADDLAAAWAVLREHLNAAHDVVKSIVEAKERQYREADCDRREDEASARVQGLASELRRIDALIAKKSDELAEVKRELGIMKWIIKRNLVKIFPQDAIAA